MGIYIHLPWCKTKCPYCDFNSHRQPEELHSIAQKYLVALELEWQHRIQLLPPGTTVGSIYCGGGTPNLLPPDWYAQLLSTIQADIACAPDCEITLEANPGANRIHDYSGYIDSGFTRISLGVQSMDNATLQRLGRDYTRNEVQEALLAIATSKARSFNLDLLFAAPYQDKQLLASDLDQLLSWHPPHLSCYELTIEPNTVFFSHPPAGLPGHEGAHDMFDWVAQRLQSAGYSHYEVSAYALENHRCRHNMNYWMFGDYVALGAGAHAKITDYRNRKIVRYANQKNPERYIIDPLYAHLVEQPEEEWFFQFLLNALRLQDGILISHAAQMLITSPEDVVEKCSQWIGMGYMFVDNGRLRLTKQAWLNQNLILELMV